MSHRWFSLPSHSVRRAGAIFAAGLAAATVLTACGSSSDNSSAPGGGSVTSVSPAAAGDTADAGVAQAKADIAKAMQPTTDWPTIQKIANPASVQGKQIMIVPLIGEVAVLNGMATTAKDVLTKMGANVTICDGKASPTTVASCLQQAQSQKDYAVVTIFVAYAMAPNSFNSLAAAGTHIVIDGDEAQPGQTYPANIQFSDSQNDLVRMSQLEAEQALADKGTSANLIVEQLTDTPDQIAQGQAVVDELKKLCPNCQSTIVKMTSADTDKVPSAISAALVSHPDANVITLPVDSWMPQTIQGVQSAGRTGKVELISTGSDLDGLERVKSGQEAADLGSSVVFDGYQVVDGLMRELSGGKVLPGLIQTRDFVKSNVQGLDLTPAAYNGTQWFGSDGFEQKFLTAWGAK